MNVQNLLTAESPEVYLRHCQTFMMERVLRKQLMVSISVSPENVRKPLVF